VSKYIVRSLILGIPTLIGVFTIVFFIMRVIPGDPVLQLYGDAARPELLEELRESMGLNRPLAVQYLDYLWGTLHGDFGFSFRTNRPVAGEIFAVFPHTLALALTGIAISCLIGLPLGILAARLHGSGFDYLAMIAALLGVSAPIFWIAILLMILFSVNLKWLPLMGVGNVGSPVDLARHLVLPALALGLAGAGWMARIARSAMLDTLNQDYVRTAKAKGLGEPRVVFHHALKNALIPILSIIGILLSRLLGGSILTEAVFARPGLGKLLVDAIFQRDYPQIQATITFFAGLIILVNILVDISYAAFDPRIRYR
jgi:ABC-type dipeptide/oligopeptide/nickel transport system permease component